MADTIDEADTAEMGDTTEDNSPTVESDSATEVEAPPEVEVPTVDILAAEADSTVEVNASEAVEPLAEVVESLDNVVSAETLSNPYLLWKPNKETKEEKNKEFDTPIEVKKEDKKEEKSETPQPKKQTRKKADTAPAANVKLPQKADKSVIVMLLVSVILFFALFAPLASTATMYNDYSQCSVSFSPMDFVSFGISTVKSYFVDYKLTEEYEDYLSLKNRVGWLDLSRTLSDYELSTLQEYYKETFRERMMNYGVPLKINEFAIAVMSIIYAILALVAIISAFAMSAFYAM